MTISSQCAAVLQECDVGGAARDRVPHEALPQLLAIIQRRRHAAVPGAARDRASAQAHQKVPSPLLHTSRTHVAISRRRQLAL